MSTIYTNHEDNEAEGIRRNRRLTSIAKTYTKSVAEERAQIDEVLKAGLTLSPSTLLRAGYADTAKAALTEINKKDNN